MTTFSHLDLAYTTSRLTAVIGFTGAPTDTLARIEQLLVGAATAKRERRYLEAIDDYNSARNLIWAQLFPATMYDEVRAVTLDLTRSLASYAGEWMNVLPVETAAAGVRPREVLAIDPGPALGLRSSAVTAAGAGAAADLTLANTLAADGNLQSAAFFRQRAQATAPDLVSQLSAPAGSATPANPAAPVAGGLGPAPSMLARGISALSARAPARLEPALTALLPSSAINASQLATAIVAQDSIAATAVVQIPPAITVAQRSYTTVADGQARQLQWTGGNAPAVDDILSTLYQSRIALTRLPDALIVPERPADVAAGLPHAWYYESPLGLAECYHALGDFSSAERWYLKAAGYAYLNSAIEAPYVWSRLATLYLDWGNAQFRSDSPEEALVTYGKVIAVDGAGAPTQPATALWTLIGLAPAASTAGSVLAAIAADTDPSTLAASPAIVSVLYEIWAQLAKIQGGLDFWGHWSQHVPIWTFDYLQSVAISLTQLAVGTERDAITFWEKADAGTLTRTQLAASVTQAKAEADAADRQVDAAIAEKRAFAAGQAAANKRAADARANATEYAAKSWEWSLHQAQAAQMQGGDDGNANDLNQLADQFTSGPYDVHGSRATLSAGEQLASSRIQNQYEVDSLNRQAQDLDAAATQAAAETTAANARFTAAKASATAAKTRVGLAKQIVAAFDDQRFTPDVWNQLGQRMSDLSQRYLAMALEVAKRMQRAYNFENDVQLSIIKSDYTSDTIRGLLAADVLLADVETFTYEQIVSTTAKVQAVKQTISLAGRFPNAFETNFRTTGRMDFQTSFDDFDDRYPGTFAGRIVAVEVAVDGIVPAAGLSGTLTNAGISHFRTPLASWPAAPAQGIKHRVQPRESLVVSDYDPRADALVADNDRRRRRIFEGAGLASTWTFEMPRDVNDVDYEAILDVRLTFTYDARFDPDLRARVLSDLASLPALHARTKPLPLRWLFPDAFFALYATGKLRFTLSQEQFLRTELAPQLTGLSLIAVTAPGTSATGLVLSVTAPGHPPVTVTTQADGSVPAANLAASASGSALGAWEIGIDPAANPGWVQNGALHLDALANVALLLSYNFTPRI